MQELMHSNVLAAATLPNSAASTPTGIDAELAVSPLAPCEGPVPHRASARTQRNTTQPLSAGLSAGPSRLRTQSDGRREEQLAAGPLHAVQSTVQPRLAGGWFWQAGQEAGISAAGPSSYRELSSGNGSWDTPALHFSSNSDPLGQGQSQSLGGSQSLAQQAAAPLAAEPFPQQQTLRWHQQQVEPPTWQQQQQGWNYSRVSSDSSSIRGRSHSPRGRRRQQQQRGHQRSNSMGAYYHPHQQWQQQQLHYPGQVQQSFEGQVQHGLQTVTASQAPGQQLVGYQQQQQQQHSLFAAVDPWQTQQAVPPPPPPPPARWHSQQQQQPLDPWHQPLPQQWASSNVSSRSSSSSGGNWPAASGGGGTAAAHAWGVPESTSSSQQGSVAAPAAAAAPQPGYGLNPTIYQNPGYDPGPSRYNHPGYDPSTTPAMAAAAPPGYGLNLMMYQNPGYDPSPLRYDHPGYDPSTAGYQQPGPANLAGFTAAGSGATGAVTLSWPAAVAQQQQQQQPMSDVQSHMLSRLETDSSEEPEEWFSVTHSPVPLELQQQQQQGPVLLGSSSRWPQNPPQGVMQAATHANTVEAAAAPVQSGLQASADGSRVVLGQRQISDNSSAAAGRLGSSSGSRFVDASSSDDDDSEMPELIASPGYNGDLFYEAADPSAAWSVLPQAAAAAAGAADGGAAWDVNALQPQQQRQQVPARQLADAWAVPQQFEQVPSWPQQQQRLGSIDELQPAYGPRPLDDPAAALQAAAAAVEPGAAAVDQQDQQQQLWLQEQQLLEQQLQQLEAEAARHAGSPAALAAWRAEQLSGLAAEAAAYMAAGAAEDDFDSTAATVAGSSSDGYAPPAAAQPAAGPVELPQLARVRTATAQPARSGAALEDSPNAQMAQLMRRLQQQYDMLQQQQYTAAQLELEQQHVLHRYGLSVGSRRQPGGAGFSAGSSSNGTAAGAPYRPLGAAAAAAGPRSSTAAAAADQRAADTENAILRQLLDSASRSTQEVDATAMAALAGSWQQRQQQHWQQQQQQSGSDPAAQWEFAARRRRGMRHLARHSELPHVLQRPAAAAQPVPDQTDSRRASLDSSSWYDDIPALLDADPELDAFEGLTPTLSPPRPRASQNPSYNTAPNMLYPTNTFRVSNPAQMVAVSGGSGGAVATGWASQAGQAGLFTPRPGYLLPAPMVAAAAAAAGQAGPGVLQQQQQQPNLRLQVPPPAQLVRGRWSSSSSSGVPSPLISPVVAAAAAATGQPNVLQTPQAAILIPQEVLNAPRQRPPQQQQPWTPLQQQQWAPGSWPEMRGVYGAYSGSSTAAAAGSGGAVAGLATAGPLPPPMFAPGPGGSSSIGWQQQQQQGMAAAGPSSSRDGGYSLGRQRSMQLMMQNLMMNRNRHSQAAAAAAPAAMAADQAMPAAAPVAGIWPVDVPTNLQQQHQWQRDLLVAMQLDEPQVSINQLAAPTTAAPAAAAAAARQRQHDLQQFIQQAREGSLALAVQQPVHPAGPMGFNVVDASGLVAGAGAGPGTFRPELMVRMMRLMNLDESIMLPRIIQGGDGLSYEQLIGLEDVRVVVPDHVLAQLPRRTVPKEGLPAAADTESVICTICQCELAGQELVVQLPCKHDYHEGCICEWLSKYKKTCPVCKAEVRLDA